jgi:hypothetical protein
MQSWCVDTSRPAVDATSMCRPTGSSYLSFEGGQLAHQLDAVLGQFSVKSTFKCALFSGRSLKLPGCTPDGCRPRPTMMRD